MESSSRKPFHSTACYRCGFKGHLARDCNSNTTRTNSWGSSGASSNARNSSFAYNRRNNNNATQDNSPTSEFSNSPRPVSNREVGQTIDPSKFRKELDPSISQVIDIGVNLTHKSFRNDINDIIKRAQDKGVSPLIMTGTTVPDSIVCQKVASKLPGLLYCTAGVHPHNASRCDDKTISTLRDLATKYPEQVVAIGECGLDFNRMFSPKEVQEKWFEEQVKLAIELKKPLFLHERDSSASFIEIMNKYHKDVKGVVHCFTGTKDELVKYLEMGFYIGFTGSIWKLKHLKDILESKVVPLNRMLVETDAPFQSPKNIRRNEPMYATEVVKYISSCYNVDYKVVADQTTKNAIEFFNFK